MNLENFQGNLRGWNIVNFLEGLKTRTIELFLFLSIARSLVAGETLLLRANYHCLWREHHRLPTALENREETSMMHEPEGSFQQKTFPMAASHAWMNFEDPCTLLRWAYLLRAFLHFFPRFFLIYIFFLISSIIRIQVNVNFFGFLTGVFLTKI